MLVPAIVTEAAALPSTATLKVSPDGAAVVAGEDPDTEVPLVAAACAGTLTVTESLLSNVLI